IRKLAKISASFRSLIRKKPSNSKKMNFDGFFLMELKVYVPAPKRFPLQMEITGKLKRKSRPAFSHHRDHENAKSQFG
ncbi:hypothetical protein, partial [Staphylococcus delphini]